MTIETKDFGAYINKMPMVDAKGPTLMVYGTVTVPDTLTDAALVISPVQDKSLGLRLDLVLSNRNCIPEVGLPVLTEKQVSYSQYVNTDIPCISVFYKDAEVVRIDNVEIVM